ncbi:MAG: helix-turn-helix transcriptional regulator [Rhodocyclales bacterium]|nr:helix-turn-helix transcriptional regulator [Rhodocyclales bacterium]
MVGAFKVHVASAFLVDDERWSRQIAWRSPTEGAADDFAQALLADRLAISPKTVEVHRSRVMEKMGVRSVAELVQAVLAVRARSRRVNPELRRIQAVQRGEVLEIAGPGEVEVDRLRQAGIAAVDVAAQYADEAGMHLRRRGAEIGAESGAARRGLVFVEEQPLRGRRHQSDHVLEYADGVGELHRAAAVEVRGMRLIGRERLVGAVDVEADDHLEDGDGVLEIDGLGAGVGFRGRDRAAGGEVQAGAGQAGDAGAAVAGGRLATGVGGDGDAVEHGVRLPGIGEKAGAARRHGGEDVYRCGMDDFLGAVAVAVAAGDAQLLADALRAQGERDVGGAGDVAPDAAVGAALPLPGEGAEAPPARPCRGCRARGRPSGRW